MKISQTKAAPNRRKFRWKISGGGELLKKLSKNVIIFENFQQIFGKFQFFGKFQGWNLPKT